MAKAVGIDLGTTNSVVAVMEGGKPVVISNAEGARVTPSVVAFTKQGERLVGHLARRQAVLNPEHTIYSIKRFIGRRFDEVESERHMVSYRLKPAPDGSCRVVVQGKDYTPEEISAMVLRKLKADAEKFLGQPVTQAVITVPAYFNDSQRQATKAAGTVAGLEVLRIINEPTAAALAYGIDRTNKTELVLVFDLGGGTFDVSILEVGNGVFHVKATCGDTHLGGDDFDHAIVEWLSERFRESDQVDLKKDPQALERLIEAAERAKIELSAVSETSISLPFITANSQGPKHLDARLSRARFNQLTKHLVDRCRGPLRQALADAGVRPDQIDQVVLVGGATRMPAVQEMVRSFIEQEPNQTVNPDEVVAIGAAIQAAVLSGEVQHVVLLDVTPLSLGVETMGGVIVKLVERNTTIPTRKSELFTTAVDNQPAVDVYVYQGERPLARDNKLLGNFRLDGIAEAPRGFPQVEVSFDIDANGIVSVTAKDMHSGKQQKIQITGSTNLMPDDMARMMRDAEEHAAQDETLKERADARNDADTLCYAAARQLKTASDGAAMKRAKASLVSLRDKLKSDADVATLRESMEELRFALQALVEQPFAHGRAVDIDARKGL